MSDQVEEQAYRWQRWYVFGVTLAVVITLVILAVFLA
jgi:hypothetical protein